MRGRHTDKEGISEELQLAAVTACSNGDAFMKMGLFEDAIASYELAIELCPDLALAHRSLGEVYHAKGELLMAGAYYSLAIQCDASNADVYCCRGATYYCLGEYGAAWVDFEQALAIDPTHQKAQFYLDLINDSEIENKPTHLSAVSLTDEERQHQKSKEKVTSEVSEAETEDKSEEEKAQPLDVSGHVSVAKTGLFNHQPLSKEDSPVTFEKVDPKQYLAKQNMTMDWYYKCKM